MSSQNQVLLELREIQSKHNGILRPADVIDFAKNKTTALHSKFIWDDTKAAHEYRLEQARKVIRVSVIVLPNSLEPIRAFVSMEPDRKISGGGYKDIIDVFSNAVSRKQFLAQAFSELERWETKYNTLKELEPIIKAVARARNRKAKAS